MPSTKDFHPMAFSVSREIEAPTKNNVSINPDIAIW